MQVRQLMSRDVVTLEARTTLDIADDIMKLKRIRHLPVVDNETLVGLVTEPVCRPSWSSASTQ
jgi:CBS domain-containing protein